LAHGEERVARREFGARYEQYAAVTPRWIPHWGIHSTTATGHGA
jgi:protein-S-isoprenylcysteine O-methyltransferase Ste14